MNNIIKFLDKFFMIMLWICLLIAAVEKETDAAIILILLMINENIERLRKGE